MLLPESLAHWRNIPITIALSGSAKTASGFGHGMITRYLEYIVALAREGHFARAANACNVTQPTLSAGIKQLEESLGVLIVERRQRFVGLTPEGQRVLAWAQRILADYRGLEQELSESREGLIGQLRIGGIPVALPALSFLTARFAAEHPRARFRIASQTSREIQLGLDEFAIDVGVTYLDSEPLERVRITELYRERYVLITQASASKEPRKSLTWAEAARLPLCLLTPSMQNRRILDSYFQQAGTEVHAVMETNSLVTLWSHVRFGQWATVVPHTFLLLLEQSDHLVALPLVDPIGSHTIGLVATSHDPLTPMTRALIAFAKEVDLAADIERRVSEAWSVTRAAGA
jgi:DNA-binding transcriptional LysR family regulator